jgi:hypothetical protein
MNDELLEELIKTLKAINYSIKGLDMTLSQIQEEGIKIKNDDD